MSQQVWASINPLTTSGTMLASILTDFKDAIMSGFSGTSRPSQLQAGGMWIDSTLQSAPDYTWSFKMWTGTVDIEVFRLNVNSGFGGALTSDAIFEISQISADTTGAYLKLIKQRLLLNGQVSSGDTVGEIQFIGRTATSTDPTVGYIKWISTDDESATTSGGYLAFYSTPDATATLTEHLRLISGLVETVVPHKLNSLRLVTQDIATAATIAQLSASKYGVEFTGSTATSVQGINAGHDSQEIVLHNRSSAVITLLHQSASATAVDRLKLPNSGDISIETDGTVILFYDLTDTRWKVKSIQRYSAVRTVKTFKGLHSDWLCPAGVTKVLITTYKERLPAAYLPGSLMDIYGNAYAWGTNLDGQLGLGDVIPRSSPVAVLGGLTFKSFATTNGTSYNLTHPSNMALDKQGRAYAWGKNNFGQLGLGDVVPRSSPVAVLGGLRFTSLWVSDRAYFGIAVDGTAYAWGSTGPGTLSTLIVSSPVAVLGGVKFDRFWNTGATVPTIFYCGLDLDGNAYAWGGLAQLAKGSRGDGSTAASGSPILVLGGLTFKKLQTGMDATNPTFVVGLTKDGAAYGWGVNTFGQLGVGDQVARSSPVAVLGGLTFSDIWVSGWATNAANNSVYGITDDGTMYAWGYNSNGQLGVGDVAPRSSPVAVLGGLKFKEVWTNLNSIFGITYDGTMYAWGNGTPFIAGFLGLGDGLPRSSPVAVLGGLKFSRVVSTALNSSVLAETAEGYLYSWGTNANGELGDGTVIPKSSPVAVLGGFGHDSRSADNVISVPVVAGTTYRIFMPNQREARFANYPLGVGLEKVTIEYDTRGS